ncbi:GNAT family N-acetyltransferase [Lonsdalea britannica]|uniref:GNAT family N-acetyltransferase n=1 Tax=Lonsdalea britannica TaxID=1082704 RepID=UPI0026EA7DF6|nr:GNAT family N-acetyltransferase [Lonsdalea britannica]
MTREKPPQPIIDTPHLVLRALRDGDAEALFALLESDPRIAAMAVHIPYPCPESRIRSWIASLDDNWLSGKSVTFALCLRQGGEVVGAISLSALDSHYPEVGYWLGTEYWGRGYSTEACLAICQFAFGQLGLDRLYGCHKDGNTASGKVLLKSGFQLLGSQHLYIAELQRQEWVAFYLKVASEDASLSQQDNALAG